MTVCCFNRYRNIIPDYDQFLERLRNPSASFLRINTLKVERGELLKRFDKRGIKWKPTLLEDQFVEIPGDIHPGGLWEYHLGLIHPQALSSAVPVLALEPTPGDFIFDMCAAPGGKTAHMAALMQNTGLIIANDKNVTRLVALRANLKRLGVLNTAVTMRRGEQFRSSVRFSKILLDAPCSAEGGYIIDDRGRILNRQKIGKGLNRIQKQLIRKAAELLSSGGTLVYSTCTYNPDENEGVVQYVLEESDMEVVDIEVPFPHQQGIVEWQGVKYDEQLGKTWRIYPHQAGSVGFFVAKLVKR